MTVNQAIAILQEMISNGDITGNECFGSYEYNWESGEYFEEAEEIRIVEDEEWGDVVYVS